VSTVTTNTVLIGDSPVHDESPVLEDYVRENEAAKCNCPHQCRELIYQPTVSQAPLSKTVALVVRDVDISDICFVKVLAPNECF